MFIHRCYLSICFNNNVVILRVIGAIDDKSESKSKLQYLKMMVYSLCIDDLTEVGKLHHQIVWRKSSALKSEFPMISIDMATSETFVKLQVLLEEARICFIFRFITELITFFSTSLINPLTIIIDDAWKLLSTKLEDIGNEANLLSASATSVTFIENKATFTPFQIYEEDDDDDNISYLEAASMESRSSSNESDSETPSMISDFYSSDSSMSNRPVRRKSAATLGSYKNSGLFSTPMIREDDNENNQRQSKKNLGWSPRVVSRKQLQPKESLPKKEEAPHSDAANKKDDYTFQWCLGVIDLFVIDPRNSYSHDMLGIHVDYGSICNMNPSMTWTLPTGAVSAAKNKTFLKFDLKQNKWIFRQLNQVNGQEKSSLSPKQTFESWRHHIPIKSDNTQDNSIDMAYDRHGDSNGPVSDHLNDYMDENTPSISDHYFDTVSYDKDLPIPKHSPKQFEFTVHPNPNDNWKNESEIPSCPYHQKDTPYDSSSIDEDDQIVSRYSIQLSNVNAFMTIQRSHTMIHQVIPDTFYFAEVEDNRQVYHIKRSYRHLKGNPVNGHQNHHQHWKKISMKSFGVLLVFDNTKTQSRLLITDIDSSIDNMCLHADLSMGEFYALLSSVWFDNFFEQPQQFQSSSQYPSTAPSNANNNQSHETATDNSFLSWPRYGTKEYWEKLRHRSNYFVLSIVRNQMKFDCSMETNYFIKDPPSLQYLSPLHHLHRSKESEVLPIASMYASGVVLQLLINDESVQLAVGAGSMNVIDIRNPSKSCEVQALNIPSNRPCPVDAKSRIKPKKSLEKDFNETNAYQDEEYVIYGFSSFDFGLQINPSILMDKSNEFLFNADIPIQYVFMSSATAYWKTNCIGLVSADLTINNIDFLLIITDYFSLYFRSEEYGHPGVEAFNQLGQTTLPYGGIDTRLFLKRPLIAIMEDPFSISSQLLCLEADKGVFYRYLVDSHSSERQEVRIFDLSLTILENYVNSWKARGVRGSAGSGRGAKTLIEYLDADLSYHFDALRNIVDFAFAASSSKSDDVDDPLPPLMKTSPPSPRRKNLNNNQVQKIQQNITNREYIDFESENVFVEPIEIEYPRTVISIESVNGLLTSPSCDIIISYEDILFILNVIVDYIKLESPTSHPGSPESDSSFDRKGNGTVKFSGKDSAASDSMKTSRLSSRKKMKSMNSKTFIELATVPNNSDQKNASNDLFARILISGFRILLVDNILGLHRPLLQVIAGDIFIVPHSLLCFVLDICGQYEC